MNGTNPYPKQAGLSLQNPKPNHKFKCELLRFGLKLNKSKENVKTSSSKAFPFCLSTKIGLKIQNLSMVFSLCKTLSSIRAAAAATAAATALSASKDLNFLQHLTPLLSTRPYISKKAADQHAFTVSCLVNSFGLSPESALSAAKVVRFANPERPDSFISFFKSHGFSQTQIASLIEKRPRLLLYIPDSFSPKFDYFYSIGFTTSDLPTLLAVKPQVLERSLNGLIIPIVNFFKDFTCLDEKRVFLALHCRGAFTRRNIKINDADLASNLRLLQRIGVPHSYAMNAYVERIDVFSTKHDEFKAVVEEVKKLGFDPSKFSFVHAVLSFLWQDQSTWERKFNLFKEWGWSEAQFWCAFRKHPKIMQLSYDNAEATMDFYVNEMGWGSRYFADHPHLVALGLKKRIIPRGSVVKYLLSRGLIKDGYSIQSVLMCTEKQFLDKFVIRFEDPKLLKLYEEKRVGTRQFQMKCTM